MWQRKKENKRVEFEFFHCFRTYNLALSADDLLDVAQARQVVGIIAEQVDRYCEILPQVSYESYFRIFFSAAAREQYYEHFKHAFYQQQLHEGWDALLLHDDLHAHIAAVLPKMVTAVMQHPEANFRVHDCQDNPIFAYPAMYLAMQRSEWLAQVYVPLLTVWDLQDQDTLIASQAALLCEQHGWCPATQRLLGALAASVACTDHDLTRVQTFLQQYLSTECVSTSWTPAAQAEYCQGVAFASEWRLGKRMCHQFEGQLHELLDDPLEYQIAKHIFSEHDVARLAVQYLAKAVPEAALDSVRVVADQAIQQRCFGHTLFALPALPSRFEFFATRYEEDGHDLVLKAVDLDSEAGAVQVMHDLLAAFTQFIRLTTDPVVRAQSTWMLYIHFGEQAYGADADEWGPNNDEVWKKLCTYPAVRPLLAEYLRRGCAYVGQFDQDGFDLWEQECSQLNNLAAFALAAAERQYIPLAASYFNAWNTAYLENPEELLAVAIEQHGWCEETEIAMVNYCGMPHHQSSEYCIAELADDCLAYIGPIRDSRFLQALVANCLWQMQRNVEAGWERLDDDGYIDFYHGHNSIYAVYSALQALLGASHHQDVFEYALRQIVAGLETRQYIASAEQSFTDLWAKLVTEG